MKRNFFNLYGGVCLLGLLLALGVIFLARGAAVMATLQSPLPTPPPTATPTWPTTACVSQTERGVTFDWLGYRNDGAGMTTLAFRITNPQRVAVDAIGFTTAGWTRIAPADRSIYLGSLGGYDVRWVLDLVTPNQAGFRFQPKGTWFKNGGSEIFTLTVRDFDPTRSLTVWARANLRLAVAQGRPADYACDRTPPPPTPTPTPLPFSPLPTPTPTPEGGVTLPMVPQVAQCVFTPPPGGIPDQPIIPLSAYSFSEPQLVVTNTAPIGIQQWLPDSETLLITRHTDTGNALDSINTQTGEITRLVGPNLSIIAPRWLTEEKTAIWLELNSNKTNNEPGYWLRSFDPVGERRLTDDGRVGWSITHDVSPDGKAFIFLSLPGGTQPLIWNQESKTLRAVPVDLANWRYQNGPIYPFQPFNINWQPGGEKILFWDGTWVFLYDLATNSGCEINLQDLAGINDSILRANWSPNGRYLLAQITQDPPYTTLNEPYDRVLILDTYSGDAVQYSLGTVVYNFSWAPNNQIVAVEEKSDQEIDGFPSSIFYLLNIHSGEHIPVLTEGTVLGVSGQRVLWSPNGTTLAYQCKNTAANGSTSYIDRICISHVTVSQ